jgi:hypothetical protein
VNCRQWLTRLTPVEEEVEINIQTKMPHFLRCMFGLKTNKKENILGNLPRFYSYEMYEHPN